MMASMIRRDRNRPSVILWGMMNEGRSRKLLERLKATAAKHDPTRPTVYADNKLADGVTHGTVFIPQVLGINYMLESIDAFHSAYPQLKLLVSEHTNADRAVRGDLEQERLQAERIASDLDIIESRLFLAGSTLWSMHDYGTDYEPVWPVQRSGILDEYRLPKEAYHMLAARWSRHPVLHIASDWNGPHAEGEEVEVRIYTNCSQVELSLNGRSLGTKAGQNPAVWRVPYSPGEITAVAGGENLPVLCRTVSSPGRAHGIVLTCPDTMKADGRDCVVAVVQVVDEGNRPVAAYAKTIALETRGPGRVVAPGGSKEVLPRAGLAAIVVKSTGRKGKVIITASGEDLSPASATVSCA
jgi:beta-galactosidase